MHIIYHCVGGAHSSVIASSIHLGTLPGNRVPTKDEILNISHFDNVSSSQHGCIIPRGIDEYGNNIYTLSRQFSGRLIIKALKDLSMILSGNGDSTTLLENGNSVTFINVSPAVNVTMKIGGFLSRKLNMVSLGRPIVLWGSRKAYMDIARIAIHTKEGVRQMQNP